MEVLSCSACDALSVAVGVKRRLALGARRLIRTLLTVGRAHGALLLFGEELLSRALIAPLLVQVDPLPESGFTGVTRSVITATLTIRLAGFALIGHTVEVGALLAGLSGDAK